MLQIIRKANQDTDRGVERR